MIDGTECKYVQYKTTKAPRQDIANTYFHVMYMTIAIHGTLKKS